MRVLLVSDLHANPFALAVLPPADVVLCAGDLVDYGPDPRSIIAWCRARARAVVHGNHDRALAFDEDDGVGQTMRTASAETRLVHRGLLDAAEIGYLRDLPRVATVELGPVTFALAHATAGDPRHYAHLANAAASVHDAVPAADVIVVGHTHVQGTVGLDRAVAVNPGSAGMSSRGGFAHYALWDDGTITLHEVPYDAEAALRALDALPLSNEVRATLRDAFRNGRRTSAS
jgi:predicted phosphodiesterase